MLSASELGLELNWRIGAAGKTFSDAFFDTVQMTGGLRALRPLSPVHLKHEWTADGDLALRWIRRGRIDADSWLGTDIPLGEDNELYAVEVWQGGSMLRHAEVETPFWTYVRALRAAETAPGPFSIRVAMVGARSGAGDAAMLVV